MEWDGMGWTRNGDVSSNIRLDMGRNGHGHDLHRSLSAISFIRPIIQKRPLILFFFDCSYRFMK